MKCVHLFSALVLLCCGLVGCAGNPDTLFERLPPERTGVTFANTIIENDSLLNPLSFDYVYNGAGVGVGDINNDGWPDLYFAGNVVSNQLYLNQGDFHFEDVTQTAGVAAEEAWSTGVAMVDINQDGWLDIYVCVAGPGPEKERANRLFINQGVNEKGVPIFEEMAEEYGLADTGYSTQAAFLDYDRDGDLDMYLLTNAREESNRNLIQPKKVQGEAPSTDRLYRNNGDETFTDVSEEAGIRFEGYGLGLAVSDINRDGWPDIYVANDFVTNDLLYVNNGDGTFTNRAGDYLKAQSHNGMGTDVADYNNDGLVDIVVLDMLPMSNYRRKMMIPSGNYNTFHMLLDLGYQPQYIRNTLQLNNGASPQGSLTFSEIGRLAGVHATDWSWAPLFADVDNDGWKDLFISNGYGKDVTNLDFIDYGAQATFFGTEEAQRERVRAALKELPEVKLPNVIFQNDGDLTFTERTQAWGLGIASLSNGAAFADLDRDGDLDLVTNNINDEAFVLENHVDEREDSHYLRLRLDGPPGNLSGFGAKVVLHHNGKLQYHDHSPYRGYKSTVQPIIHFGLGAAQEVDSLEVFWPDGRYQRFTDVVANQVLTLHHTAAAPREQIKDRRHLSAEVEVEPYYPFEEVARARGLTYTHEEHAVADFKKTPLLPHKLSQGGPALAVGDVDGNGLDDVFVGADKGQERTLFLQTVPGQFAERPVPMDADRYEDRGALFFDADGDDALDLYIVSGGNHAESGDAVYQDRLYMNDGTGRFRRIEDALPEMHANGSVVTAADYDGDGDLDLFVGGHHLPGQYPLPPRSYLLRNDSEAGKVKFVDVTKEIAPALVEAGLVTDALWTDFNQDGRIDLLLAGEWMPLTVFENKGGRFVDVTAAAGLSNTVGWWNSLAAGDFDNDGDIDYVAGNLGLNSKFDTSEEEPVRIYAKDFDDNSSLDPVMTYYIQGEEVPVHPRGQMVRQITSMQRRFSSYASYAEAAFDEVFTEEELKDAYVAEAFHFETSYLENQGDGTFAVRTLPLRAQFAPIYGMHSSDYDGDGNLDILLVGNSYATETRTGWYDAFTGLFLRGDGDGYFEAVPSVESGFFAEGDAKALAEVTTQEGSSLILVTQHNGPLKAFTRPMISGTRLIRARPLDRYALLAFEDGRVRRVEFYWGTTYLSQASRTLRVPEDVKQVVIVGAQGQRRTLDGVVAESPPKS